MVVRVFHLKLETFMRAILHGKILRKSECIKSHLIDISDKANKYYRFQVIIFFYCILDNLFNLYIYEENFNSLLQEETLGCSIPSFVDESSLDISSLD